MLSQGVVATEIDGSTALLRFFGRVALSSTVEKMTVPAIAFPADALADNELGIYTGTAAASTAGILAVAVVNGADGIGGDVAGAHSAAA